MIPCNWRLYLCGINHKSSLLEDREPLQIGHDEIASAHAVLSEISGIKESIIISTCNRIEIYFVAGYRIKPFDIVAELYRELKNLDITTLEDSFYIKQDKHTAAHLFRVAAGIDSMVIGENQIFGQAKEAYRSACAIKSTGKVIHRLFHQAFRIGKQVRTSTELGKGACSVSSATVDMLKTKIAELEKPSILFIGINKMIALAAAGLNKLGYTDFTFANRTGQKAIEFGKKYHSEGYGLDSLVELIGRADVVVCCTGAEKPILTDDIIGSVYQKYPGKNLLIADMAAPRDVEIKNIYKGLEVYDLEAVQAFLEEQQAKRREAIPQVEQIIENRLEQFIYWYDHIRHEPGYNGLENSFEVIRNDMVSGIEELLPADAHAIVDKATRQMIERLLQLKIRAESRMDKME